MTLVSADALFATIGELVACHSPSGMEGEIDGLLLTKFASLGHAAQIDSAGNLYVKIKGTGYGSIAITAHKDEIGAIVTEIQDAGRVKVKRIGGAFPWVYGEGPVDLLGTERVVSGVLSFGSRHVSHASPQHVHQDKEPVRWADVWVETKLTAEELAAAGVLPGVRMVISKSRKIPVRLQNHIASYALDNKASLAILLGLGRTIANPFSDIYLVATSKEEVGAVGALYFTQRNAIDAMVALEICPIAPEYPTLDGPDPVLLVEDAYGLYDFSLNSLLKKAASNSGIRLQSAALNGFGSDGSIAMKAGHVSKASCLSFPTQNTHGFEITHLGAISSCLRVLEAFTNLDGTTLSSILTGHEVSAINQ